MLKLSDRNWRSFYLKDLFEIVLSKGDNKPNELENGNMPLVSAGNSNNGVVKFIDEGDGISEVFSGNCITVDMFGKAFYQKNDFYSVSHGRVNILIPKFELTEKIGIFLVTYFDNRFLLEYSFGRMCTSTQLANEVFDLPIKPNTNDPDWDFIENYMLSLEPKSDISTLLELLKDESPERIAWFNEHINMEDFKKYLTIKSDKKFDIEIVETVERERERVVCNSEGQNRLNLTDRVWQGFSLIKLFGNCQRGSRLKSSDRVSGTIPLVTAGFKNDGIAMCIDNPDMELFSHSLTIDMFGFSCYRDYEFHADDNIIVFKNDLLNKYHYLFISVLLNQSRFKYDFVRQYRQNNYNNHIISLPVVDKGYPDWDFIEQYMRQVECDLTV